MGIGKMHSILYILLWSRGQTLRLDYLGSVLLCIVSAVWLGEVLMIHNYLSYFMSQERRDLTGYSEGWRISYAQRIENTNRHLSHTQKLLAVHSLGPFSLFFHRQNQGSLTIWWAHQMTPGDWTVFWWYNVPTSLNVKWGTIFRLPQ